MYSTLGDDKERETNRPFVLGAILLAMFMAAIEATIVATAMPEIVSDLGGFSLYSWTFSAYLLMQAVSTLIYGKLSDLFGRKPVFVFGVSIFLIGSLLCGFATSMVVLIMFRLIQGLGAGAVQPIATTIVGDIYSVEERAKIQGYLSSVWGISSVIGPLLGGLFVQFVSWSWIFWINIPLGIAAIIGVVVFLREDPDKKKREIDYTGALLLLVAVTALMIVSIEGGVGWAWISWPVFALSAVFLVSFLLFVVQEKRVKEPVMPIELWKNPLIACSNLATLTSGMMMIGVSSFLPAFVQGVTEEPPVVAGFTLTTMSIGWPIASTVAGRLVLKLGFRSTALLGTCSLLAGGLFFLFLTEDLGVVWAGSASFLVGIGMGLTSTTFIIAIQSSVDWNRRGIATASNMFMRILGSAVGAAILGGILNGQLKRYFAESGEPFSVDAVNELLDEQLRGELPNETLSLLQDGLTVSLDSVFTGLFVLALVTFAIVLCLPKFNFTKKESSDEHHGI